MLYIGYIAKTEQYIQQGLKPVCIARFSPKWLNVDKWTIFAPSVELLTKFKNGEVDESQYKTLYLSELNRQKSMIDTIVKFANLDNVVMVCYEKPNKFCHRIILAEYLKLNYDLDVKEYVFE